MNDRKRMNIVGGCVSVAVVLSIWGYIIAATGIWHATQNPAATKNRIPNPYQDSRALEFGSKPRATYHPTTETWRVH